jgi:coupling of ubiquitin conjugation to ER degradation protein 1
MADADETQLNLPSLVVILVISGLVIRYFFFSSSPTSGTQSPSSSSGRGGRATTGEQAAALARAREAAAERVMQMFPQVDRRAALWDLQRNGGSVAATTERVLAGRLETVRYYSLPFSSLSVPFRGGSDAGLLLIKRGLTSMCVYSRPSHSNPRRLQAAPPPTTTVRRPSLLRPGRPIRI